MEVGKGRVVKVTGIVNKGRTATVLLRGSNKLVSECVCICCQAGIQKRCRGSLIYLCRRCIGAGV